MFDKKHKAKRELIMKTVAIIIFLSMVGLALAGAF
jgi:hypothetical protein